MNTNDFTKAARAEAERRYPALNPDAEELTYPRSALREHKRSAHVAGWEAARTHLAAQEPTDAEVQEAAIALLAFIHNEPVERIREVYGVLDRDGHWSTQARAALSAARAARRDEEKR